MGIRKMGTWMTWILNFGAKMFSSSLQRWHLLRQCRNPVDLISSFDMHAFEKSARTRSQSNDRDFTTPRGSLVRFEKILPF
jgi:hypothetical protein